MVTKVTTGTIYGLRLNRSWWDVISDLYNIVLNHDYDCTDFEFLVDSSIVPDVITHPEKGMYFGGTRIRFTSMAGVVISVRFVNDAAKFIWLTTDNEFIGWETLLY